MPALTTEKKIFLIQKWHERKNITLVQRAWRTAFITKPPDRRAIQRVIANFETNGSVRNKKPPGRPARDKTNDIAAVQRELQHNSQLSVRKLSAMLHINVTGVYRIIKHLGLNAYRSVVVQELLDDDLLKRVRFCNEMIDMYEEEPHMLDLTLWTDESCFNVSGTVSTRNAITWAKQNPKTLIQKKMKRKSLCVWAGLYSGGIIGPYFFEDTCDGDSYLEMMEEKVKILNMVIPELKRRRIYRTVLWQQDGAPAHHANQVKDWLNEKFPDRWIGRNGPILWPPRSPDLTPPDFYLWGMLKQKVYSETLNSQEELRQSIEQHCGEISILEIRKACRSVVSRFERCRDNNGGHIVKF